MKRRSPSEWDWVQCNLEKLHEWEQAKREVKNIESKRKLWEIYSEEERSEWKEKENFFLLKWYFKCCNLYLIWLNYSEFVLWFFHSKRKVFQVNLCVFVWLTSYASAILAEIYSNLYRIFLNMIKSPNSFCNRQLNNSFQMIYLKMLQFKFVESIHSGLSLH